MSEAVEQKNGKSGWIALVLLSVLAGGAGAAHGLFVAKSASPPDPKQSESISAPAHGAAPAADPAKDSHGGHGAPASPADKKVKLPSKIVSRDLPPLITNIQLPPDMWIRVEGTLVYDQADIESPEILVADVSADLLGFLRNLTLREIQGADGLMFLRQDLKERIALRSDKKVRDFVIQALVVQ